MGGASGIRGSGGASEALSRSEVMARVRSKNTTPEKAVRSGLHARGYRFRLHRADLPGRPDIVLPRYRAIVEVRGCFWHGHPDCGRMPKSNLDYWVGKISRNRARDLENAERLLEMGWRLCVVWECSLRRSKKLSDEALFGRIEAFIASDETYLEIEGKVPTSAG